MKPHRFIILCVVTLLMIVQSLSFAHAAGYAGEPHDHDGAVCEITLITSDQHHIVPFVPVIDHHIAGHVTEYATPYLSIYRLTPHGRAPPPRGPPTISG